MASIASGDSQMTFIIICDLYILRINICYSLRKGSERFPQNFSSYSFAIHPSITSLSQSPKSEQTFLVSFSHLSINLILEWVENGIFSKMDRI